MKEYSADSKRWHGVHTLKRMSCTRESSQKEMSTSSIQGPSYAAMILWHVELSAQHDDPKINQRYASTLTQRIPVHHVLGQPLFCDYESL